MPALARMSTVQQPLNRAKRHEYATHGFTKVFALTKLAT
jgi:hypothetical protein